jgi:hypothetical protein
MSPGKAKPAGNPHTFLAQVNMKVGHNNPKNKADD